LRELDAFLRVQPIVVIVWSNKVFLNAFKIQGSSKIDFK